RGDVCDIELEEVKVVSPVSSLCPDCLIETKKPDLIYKLEGRGCDVVRCPNCGLIHLFPVPTPAIIETYYGDRSTEAGVGYYYYPADPVFYEANIHDAKVKFRAARGHMTDLPGDARLLDIGCGSGAFVKAMNDEGLKPIGTDYSVNSV